VRQLPMSGVAAPIRHPAKLLELIDSETLQSLRRLHIRRPFTWLRYVSARILEQYAVKQFHLCTAVAEADARMLRALAPNVPVHVVPNGVDAEYFAPQALEERPNSVIFFGAMSFPPNVTAVLHFYQNILPIIRQEIPDAEFIIAGRDPAPAIQQLKDQPGVIITGLVDDLRPWLAQASIMICPMVMGSGIKNKVLEAMAMARPVVSTSLGVEALEVKDRSEVWIADDPAAFARAVVELLRCADKRYQLGQSGRDFVLRRYTWEVCAAKYDALYTTIANRKPGNGS
jgi:polysaccharide biosynthesis protein PslH